MLAFTLLILPSVSAVTITNTTFFSSESNSTIFVDSITLDNATVTANVTQFINLTSVGSNFTNTNATSTAFADFIGLDINLTILNVNTSIELFTSTAGDQDFNASFIAGQVLRILAGPTAVLCGLAERAILNLTVIFFAIAVMLIPAFFLFKKGLLSIDTDPKILITIFVGIILGVVFIQVIANSVVSFCA